MRLRLLLVLLTLWGSSTNAWCSQADFDLAVQALEDGQAQAASDLLSPYIQEGVHLFGIYYNLGIAQRELGQLPQARLAFERALLAKPGDLATRRRLREVKSSLDPQIHTLDVRGTPWWTERDLAILAFLPLLCLLFWSLFGRSFFQPKAEHSPKFGIAAVLGWALICCYWLATAPPPSRGIILLDGATLVNDPMELKTLKQLPPGLMVELLESDRHLRQIRLGSGETGWIRSAQVTPLYPGQPATGPD